MLEVSEVKARYGAAQVLWDITLSVEDGEPVALLGRNGAGKTTLLRTIMGLHPASGGQISQDEEDLTSKPAHRRAQHGITIVPQGRGIFPHLTVEENLSMGLAALHGRDDAKDGEIPDAVLDLFPVLRSMLARKGGNLSGGQQQQLSIARALVTQPRLLLLDEPTEGLQPSIVHEIEESLARIRQELGVSMLLVEQHLEFAWRFSDRFYVMQKGRIVEEGTTEGRDASSIGALMSI